MLIGYCEELTENFDAFVTCVHIFLLIYLTMWVELISVISRGSGTTACSMSSSSSISSIFVLYGTERGRTSSSANGTD